MVFLGDIQNVAADLSSAQFVNISTYTTPARDEVANYLYLYKRDAANADTAITIDNSDPTVTMNYDFALPAQDGNFVYINFEFPVWSAGAYVLNDCVYKSGVYYKANTSTSGTPGASGDWDVITDILAEVLNLGSGNVTITQGYAFSTAVAEAGPIGDAMATVGPRIVNGACRNLNEVAGTLYGAALIESAWMNFRRQDYTEAQEIMDFVDQQFATSFA